LYMYRNIISQAEEGEVDKEYLDSLEEEFIDIVKLFDYLIPAEE